MVPEIVRLERAEVCGCGELVAAGERAGYAKSEQRVVCLRCLADQSATSAGGATPRRVAGVAAPLNPWMAQEAVIVATLDALRGDWAPEPSSAQTVLHVPAEWSAATSALLAFVDQPAPSPGSAPAPPETPPAAAPLVTAAQPTAATTPVDGGLAPEPPDADAAASGARRSRHEAEPVEDRRMPAPAPRRRAGLFTRLLTVRSFRAQGQARSAGKPDAVVGALLDAALEQGVVALHHRQMPGCRGRLEHLAIGAGGIYVIDVKHFKNASIEVRPTVDNPAASDDLVVGGRVMTAAVVATARRVAVVRSLLAGVGLDDVPVSGAVCFVDGLLPLAVSDLEVRGVHVLRPHSLTALVATPGRLSADDREGLRAFLEEQLPPSP